jgi:hypothetical protein
VLLDSVFENHRHVALWRQQELELQLELVFGDDLEALDGVGEDDRQDLLDEPLPGTDPLACAERTEDQGRAGLRLLQPPLGLELVGVGEVLLVSTGDAVVTNHHRPPLQSIPSQFGVFVEDPREGVRRRVQPERLGQTRLRVRPILHDLPLDARVFPHEIQQKEQTVLHRVDPRRDEIDDSGDLLPLVDLRFEHRPEDGAVFGGVVGGADQLDGELVDCLFALHQPPVRRSGEELPEGEAEVSVSGGEEVLADGLGQALPDGGFAPWEQEAHAPPQDQRTSDLEAESVGDVTQVRHFGFVVARLSQQVAPVAGDLLDLGQEVGDGFGAGEGRGEAGAQRLPRLSCNK